LAGGEGDMFNTATASRPGKLGISFRPAKGKIKSATLIDPMRPGFTSPLEIKADRENYTIDIPQMLSQWVIVAWEVEFNTY
jgi:hypothetical protein